MDRYAGFKKKARLFHETGQLDDTLMSFTPSFPSTLIVIGLLIITDFYLNYNIVGYLFTVIVKVDKVYSLTHFKESWLCVPIKLFF